MIIVINMIIILLSYYMSRRYPQKHEFNKSIFIDLRKTHIDRLGNMISSIQLVFLLTGSLLPACSTNLHQTIITFLLVVQGIKKDKLLLKCAGNVSRLWQAGRQAGAGTGSANLPLKLTLHWPECKLALERLPIFGTLMTF